jgi:hypothetical protein
VGATFLDFSNLDDSGMAGRLLLVRRGDFPLEDAQVVSLVSRGDGALP